MINTGNNRYNDEINKAVMLIKLVNLLNLSPFPKQLEEAHQAKMDLLFTIFFFLVPVSTAGAWRAREKKKNRKILFCY
jgi:hypothetical protein